MMAWNLLNSQSDLDDLLQLFGGFHDGCVREAHVWTEHSVDTEMRMSVSSGLDTRVRLLIQRQWRDLSAIELLFEQVTTFHLQPSPDNYDSIIHWATLLHDGDTFYWADAWGWLPTGETRDRCTWVAAKKVSWRDASHWMGPELRYGAADTFSSPPDPV